MSFFFDALSGDILSDSRFIKSFEALSRSAILASLSLPQEEKLTVISIKKLLESAAIFADSSFEHANLMAQRICASVLALKTNGGDVEFDDLIQIIQSKLSNFPAIAFLKKDLKAPERAPIFIQMDFIAHRENHTIRPTPKRSFVLNDFQLSAWKNMGSGDPISLSAPTSAGKSFIVLLFLIHFLAEKSECTIAYVVPTRALINQVSDDVRNSVLESNVQNVVVSSSPIRLSADQQKSRVVFVFTQERLDLFLNDNPAVKFDLVIIDEAQMIAGGARGVLLEAVIDRLKFANSSPRIFFAGPLIANPEYFAKIFSLEKLKITMSTKSVTVQNMIYLNYRDIPDRVVDVSIQTASGQNILYRHPLEIIIASETDRISYSAAKFGRSGSSLVYANGKADAEKIGVKICQASTERFADVQELIKFVRKHVHDQYLLVETLPYGVAFHYGHMPALLRKELEDAFRSRKIGILVCTSTLLHGLNLPARSIFMSKPTTGRGANIRSEDFWNLAGRAGRLAYEFEGDIFLIDYERWNNDVLAGERRVHVRSALASGLKEKAGELKSFLDDETIPSGKKPELEIMAGKLLSDLRSGTLGSTINRYVQQSEDPTVDSIVDRLKSISEKISVSTDTLQKNITISPFRQQALLDYLVGRIPQIGPEELMPMSPMGDFSTVLKNFQRIFKRAHTYLLGYPGADKRHFYYAPLALRWARGEPLPAIIDSAIRYNKERKTSKSVAAIIRGVMEEIESDLRFKYVNLLACYNDLLGEALVINKMGHLRDRIENIPLYLELGASSGVMVHLLSFGLSRITSQVLADYILNKAASAADIRDWLASRQYQKLDISQICISEVDVLVLTLINEAA